MIVISCFLISIGVLIILISFFGIFRFSEPAKILQSTSITDSLGFHLVILGFIFLSNNALLAARLFTIIILGFLSFPNMSYAILNIWHNNTILKHEKNNDTI
jgi:multisubunit Na+/H+ antiporter MnhG subunit